jgi:uncharacterized protein DUF3224
MKSVIPPIIVMSLAVVSSAARGPAMQTTHHVHGAFDVKLAPMPTDTPAPDPTQGRMSVDKQYHGALDGTGRGQMLTVGTDVKDSAAYVAIERVVATLEGRKGTFALQHSGTMARGAQHLSISVVPDSGTGELVGITGTMGITITDGKHFYDFEYSLPVTR